MRRLLVLGARKDSLGAHIATVAAQAHRDIWPEVDSVETAGVSGETYEMDITEADQVADVILNNTWTDIVCTVGCPELHGGMFETIAINGVYPLVVMDVWCNLLARVVDANHVTWVNISSNSARIPRSVSPGYCAGKAALSMGTEAIARREAKLNSQLDGSFPSVRIWGYEPGFIVGTPMSTVNGAALEGPMHRMPDGRSGLNVHHLASMIVHDIAYNSNVMMGRMHRFDAGDM